MSMLRNEKIALLALLIAILGALASWLVVPEFREWVGLSKPITPLPSKEKSHPPTYSPPRNKIQNGLEKEEEPKKVPLVPKEKSHPPTYSPPRNKIQNGLEKEEEPKKVPLVPKVIKKIIAEDNFESGTLEGGSGWIGPWEGEGYASVKPSSKAKQGSYVAIVWGRSEGSYIMRSIDLSSAIKPRLQFWGKPARLWRNALNPQEEDYAVVQVSQDKEKWHPVCTWIAKDYVSGDTEPYRFVDVDLSSYAGVQQLWIKFTVFYKSIQMLGDYPSLYIDDLKILDISASTEESAKKRVNDH